MINSFNCFAGIFEMHGLLGGKRNVTELFEFCDVYCVAGNLSDPFQNSSLTVPKF
jgi:hypothetical protein